MAAAAAMVASEAVGGCFVFAVLEDDELVDDELEDWESLLARLVALVLDWGLSLELVVVLEVEDDDDDEEVEGGGVFEGVACWVYANCCSTFKEYKKKSKVKKSLNFPAKIEVPVVETA